MAKKTTKTTKKSTTKKEYVKKVEQTVIETPNDEMEVALDAIEEGAKEIEQEEDTVFGEEEVSLAQEKVDFVDQDPPIEVMNGDPTVVTTVDEIEEEAMAETFKENKKKRLIDNMIGYSWNGQEIDYIL